jgi:hypothetical protein
MQAKAAGTLAAPTVTPTPAAVDQGQTSNLTSTPVTTGTSPYTYQWFEEAPNASYVAVGTNSTSFSFVTLATTATGSWAFILQVNDSADESVNSAAVSVTVNAALAVPTVTAKPAMVDVGQTSSLTSNTVSTGTAPYIYRWLQKAPNATSYTSISSATSANYSFVTSASTAVGAWGFELQVNDSAGSTVTSSAAAVTVNVALTVSVSPTSWTTDVGQSKTFTATAAGGSGNYTSYQWYVNSTAQSNQTASTFNYSPTAVGSFLITATVNDSLGSTSAQSAAATVTVSNALTVTVSPASFSMDVGQSKNITATPAGGSGSFTSYQWYIGGVAQSGQNASTFNYSAVSAGSYSITVTVTDSSNATSPQSTATIVTVNSALAPPTVSASTGTIDLGQNSSLSSTAVSTGTSSYTYQWYSKAPGNSSYLAISGANSSTYSFVTNSATASGSWSFELQVTDSASAVVTSNATPITVNSILTVGVSPSTANLNAGQSQKFTANASGGSGNYSSYQWYVSGVAQSGQTAPTFNYSPAGVGSYPITVTVTDSLGVTSAQSTAATVTENTALTVSVSPTSSAADVGQSMTFTATAAGGSGTYKSYQWYVNGTAQSDETASTFSYSPSSAGSFSINVTVTDSLGTTSPQSTAVSLKVYVDPSVSISPMTCYMDVGQSETFTATPAGGSGTYTGYQWYIGGVDQNGATSKTFTYSASSAGSPFITVTVTDSLGATSWQPAAPYVPVSASPTVSISPVGPLTINAAQIETFTATASGGSGTINYQWYLGGSAVSGGTGSSYSFSGSAGSYTITCLVTDSAVIPVTSPVSNAVSVTVSASSTQTSTSTPGPTSSPTQTSSPTATPTPTPTASATTSATPTPSTTPSPTMIPLTSLKTPSLSQSQEAIYAAVAAVVIAAVVAFVLAFGKKIKFEDSSDEINMD